jgi:hypothetical protein
MANDFALLTRELHHPNGASRRNRLTDIDTSLLERRASPTGIAGGGRVSAFAIYN